MSNVTVDNHEDVLHMLDKMDKYSFKVGFRRQIFACGLGTNSHFQYGGYEFSLPHSILNQINLYCGKGFFGRPQPMKEMPCAGMCWGSNISIQVMNILDVACTSRTSGVAAVEFIKPFNPTAGWSVFGENAEVKDGWHPVVACVSENGCLDCVKAGHLCFDARKHLDGNSPGCDCAKIDFAYFHKGEFVCSKRLTGLSSKVKFFGKNFGTVDVFSSRLPWCNPDVDEWLEFHCFPGISLM